MVSSAYVLNNPISKVALRWNGVSNVLESPVSILKMLYEETI